MGEQKIMNVENEKKSQYDVFISYKSEEKVEASWVKKVLNENKISCWMAPESIPGGSSYADEINEAIKNCKVLVLILSPKAQESRWVKKEIEVALNEGKTIMPFMIENFQLQNAFNFYLSDVQRFEAYEDKASALKTMVQCINAILKRDSSEVEIRQTEESHNQKRENGIERENNVRKSFFSLKSIIATVILCVGGAFPISLLFMNFGDKTGRPIPALYAFLMCLLFTIEVAYYVWSFKYFKVKEGNVTWLSYLIIWATAILFTSGGLKIVSLITSELLYFRNLNRLSILIATTGIMGLFFSRLVILPKKENTLLGKLFVVTDGLEDISDNDDR